MAETDSRILEYLEEGLFLYGVGKVQESIARWKKVLELDPKNERALDYIESAGGDVSAYRRSSSKPPMQKPGGPTPSKAPFASPMPPPPQMTQPQQQAPVSTGPVGSTSPTIPPRMPPPPTAPPPGATPWQQAPQMPPSSQMPWQSPAPQPPQQPRQAAPQYAEDPFATPDPTPITQVPPPGVPAPFDPFASSRNPTPPGGSGWVPPRPTPPTPPPPAAPNPFMPPPAGAETKEQLLAKAAALFRAKYYEAALDLLERVARDFPPIDDNVRGYMDATRTALLESMKQQWSHADQVLRPRMAPAQVMQLKLSPEAGFLLSRVDGMATVEEILAMCGLEEFIALRALTTLVQQGAIEVAR